MSEQPSNPSSAEPQDRKISAIIERLYEAFVKTKNDDDMVEFWREVPEGLEEPFISTIEGIIQQAQQNNDPDTVQLLSGRLGAFRRIHAAQQLSPVERALIAFLQAPDEASARQVFEAQHTLLQPYQALQILETQFHVDDPVTQQRIAERIGLLRELRRVNDAAMTPVIPMVQPPTVPAMPAETATAATFNNLGLRAETVYQAQTINIDQVTIQQAPLELHWLPPVAPPFNPDNYVPRTEPMRQVEAKLAVRGRAAITSVAVHGAGGVGKTVLAHWLAEKQKGACAGIIWEAIGQERGAQYAQATLNRWAGYAYGGQIQAGQQYTPADVRTLLQGHGHLLVVLDDVWDASDVQLLLEALPPDCDVLLTTRRRQVALNLDLDVYELDVLTEFEARELVALRLHARSLTQADDAWVNELINSVGRHALALDIALRSVRCRRPSEWAVAATRVAADLRASRGFGELPLDENERNQPVERSLQRSYLELSPLAQQRFRSLGVFAPGAPFTTDVAAAVWTCAPEEASDTLNLFDDTALLTAIEGGSGAWKQHTLLWLYALALLRACGEEDEVAARQAGGYLQAMRQADDAQQYYLLLADYPQLRHAFRWAIAQSLGIALDLVANCANLQATFVEYALDALDWCRQALAVVWQRGTASDVARVQGSLGNALSKIANLPRQDRGARLKEALAAYEEALRFYIPDTAPLDYAMTQNNRANILSDLATLPGEDRRGRLVEGLAAYEEALKYRRPDTAPLDYAGTQNNRANILRDLATLPGEDRRGRLVEGLAAYEEALRFYTPDTAPLAYATTQNNRANILRDLATLPGEDRRGRLVEGLAAYEEALKYRRPDTAPLDYAGTQNNRAALLRDLATLPGEDRRGRLVEGLAAYEEALKYRRPDTAPLDYAMTQNNRANILRDLATLPGEDRRGRLVEGLAAYEEALRFYTPDTAPLAYATTQNNRANILRDLATLPGEDRRGRLVEGLAAYEEALRFYTPDTAPLAYATTQNNRANILRDLATLPGEDRRGRLVEGLAAYEEALRFYTPDTAPLDYAGTQNNRANILSDLATLPGEDRRGRLVEGLAAYEEALRFYTPDTAPLAYATTQNNRANILSDLATLPGEDRRGRLVEGLAAYEEALRFYTPDTAPLDYAGTQNNRAALLRDLATLPGEDRRGRLVEALTIAWEAYTLFEYLQHGPYQRAAQNTLLRVRDVCGTDFDALWQKLNVGDCPAWLRESQDQADASNLTNAFFAFLNARSIDDLRLVLNEHPELLDDSVAALFTAIAQQYKEDEHAAALILARHDLWQACRVQGVDETFEMLSKVQRLNEALQRYIELRQAAKEDDVVAWKAAVEAGEAIFVAEFQDSPGVDWDALSGDLASAYTALCVAHEKAGDFNASLAATERAIALQPNQAMWQRNRAGTLVDLGRLDEADQALATARAMEPGAARLKELEEQLAQARAAKQGEGAHE